MRNNWFSRILSWIAAALVGVVYGTAGTIAHSLMWGPIPVGLIVGAIACGALLMAVRTLTHDRAATLATAVGMVGMLLVISGPGPGGSIVVPNTPVGVIWIYLVSGLALLAIAWPSFSRLPTRTVAPPPEAAELPGIITSVPSDAPLREESPRHGS